jgi:4-oxalmesaconate hydratase
MNLIDKLIVVTGAASGIGAESGYYFDDTKRYIDANPALSDEDRKKISEGNTRRVFGRLKTF